MTGDPNHDGTVNITDAVIALQMAVRVEWLEAADDSAGGGGCKLKQ